MHATADRLDFAPPPQPGMLRAFGLAVLAHLLLVGALMHGLQWKRDTQDAVAEAELWSKLPQEAAPREVVQAPPPPPPPPPAPVVQAPPPPPAVKAPPQPEPPVQRQPDIALEREKQKREADRRERELERREAEKRERELEKQKQAELARERDQRRKLEAQKQQREEEAARKKEEQARLVAEAKRKEEADKKRKQEQEAREASRMAKQREENLRRIQGLAGTGAPDSQGTADRSSGPSASYAGRVAALIKRNTRFVESVPGDPAVEVEIRLAPDGTIVGQRIKKSSGNAARDEAVMRGIQATEKLPRDVDGRIHSPMLISVRQSG